MTNDEMLSHLQKRWPDREWKYINPNNGYIVFCAEGEPLLIVVGFELATKEWCVSVRREYFYALSLDEAADKATQFFTDTANALKSVKGDVE